jgi:hypothetical protein
VGLDIGVVAGWRTTFRLVRCGLELPEELDGLQSQRAGGKALAQRTVGGHDRYILTASHQFGRQHDDAVIGLFVRSKAVLAGDASPASRIGIPRDSVAVVDDRYLEIVCGCVAIENRFEHPSCLGLLRACLEGLESRVGEDRIVTVHKPAVSLWVVGPV